MRTIFIFPQYCNSNQPYLTFSIAPHKAITIINAIFFYLKSDSKKNMTSYRYRYKERQLQRVRRMITLQGSIEKSKKINISISKMGHYHKPLCEEISKVCENAIPIILMIKISIYYRRNLNLLYLFIYYYLQKIFEQINEKSRTEINGYFCIKKILLFDGNG